MLRFHRHRTRFRKCSSNLPCYPSSWFYQWAGRHSVGSCESRHRRWWRRCRCTATSKWEPGSRPRDRRVALVRPRIPRAQPSIGGSAQARLKEKKQTNREHTCHAIVILHKKKQTPNSNVLVRTIYFNKSNCGIFDWPNVLEIRTQLYKCTIFGSATKLYYLTLGFKSS